MRFHTRFVHEMIQFLSLCDKCQFKGKTKGDLQRHIHSIHEGKGPQCGLCDYRPIQKLSMTKRIELIHDNGHSTKYKEPSISTCIECGDTSTTKAGLENHTMFHKGEQLFNCEQC